MKVWLIEARPKGSTNEKEWKPVIFSNGSKELVNDRAKNWFSVEREFRAVEYVRKEKA